MKKLFISLLLALMFGTLAVLGVACSTNLGPKPKLDIDEVQEALEDEDYYVSVYKKNLDPEYKAKLSAYKDDDSITIVWFNDRETAKLYFDSLKISYDVEVKSNELQIKMIEHKLDKYEDDLDSDEIDDLEDELKDLKKELRKMKEDYSFGIDGKVVWYGTADAVKDTK